MGRQAKLKQAKRQERVARRDAFLARVAEGEDRGCLFCRRHDGGFTTVEHPLAESLGGSEVTLPNGVVCDRCNGGVLSDLDQQLAEFFPLKMRRTMLGIQSKAGKVPVTRFSTGSLRNTGDASLVFDLNSANDKKTFKAQGLGLVAINFSTKGGKRMTPRYASTLARALLKACLGCAWLDHGEMMLEPRYDHVRDAVLGAPRDGYLLMGRKADPNHTELELTYQPAKDPQGREFLGLAARFYGILFLTDSFQPKPALDVPDDEVFLIEFKSSDFPRPRRQAA